VYFLRCADGALYIGVAHDLDQRLAKHAAGSASTFTAARRPVTLVHSEVHANRTVRL
jgi:putative endonuclease